MLRTPGKLRRPSPETRLLPLEPSDTPSSDRECIVATQSIQGWLAVRFHQHRLHLLGLKPGRASDWSPEPCVDSPSFCPSDLLRNSEAGPFTVGPVLATVTCWLDSGNPLSEDHRKELLTTPNQIRLHQMLSSPLWLPFVIFICSLNFSVP